MNYIKVLHLKIRFAHYYEQQINHRLYSNKEKLNNQWGRETYFFHVWQIHKILFIKLLNSKCVEIIVDIFENKPDTDFA